MRRMLAKEVPVEAAWFHPNYKDIVRENHVFVESLPLPRVTYPDVYGTWLYFQETVDSLPSFCSCQKRAMVNFLRMNEMEGPYRLPKGVSLLRHFLPLDDISKLPYVASPNELEATDVFREGICHRCLLRVPSVRWSNLSEHSTFLHHFGWYWKQQMLEYGIDWYMPFLKDQCPDDIVALLDMDPWKAQGYLSSYQREQNLNIYTFGHTSRTIGSCRSGITDMYALSKRIRAVRKFVEHEIERRLRIHFGFPPRGKTLNNETILYLICKAVFAPHVVERHARPPALGGLTLDIFIPDACIALEYQGHQHFEPAEHLGGEKQFRMTVRRDRRKDCLCRENNIALVYFDISDKLTEDYVRTMIRQQVPAALLQEAFQC